MATKVRSSLRLAGQGSSGPVVLSPVERELVCAVLDDAVHQLAVLGGIMPDYASSAAAVEHVGSVASYFTQRGSHTAPEWPFCLVFM